MLQMESLAHIGVGLSKANCLIRLKKVSYAHHMFCTTLTPQSMKGLMKTNVDSGYLYLLPFLQFSTRTRKGDGAPSLHNRQKKQAARGLDAAS